MLADEVGISGEVGVVRVKGGEFVGSSESGTWGIDAEVPGTGDSVGEGRGISGTGGTDGEVTDVSGAGEGSGVSPNATGEGASGPGAIGDSAGDSDGDSAGAADEPASVLTASFIPAEQCPGVEQMKYLFPEAVRGITVEPPV